MSTKNKKVREVQRRKKKLKEENKKIKIKSNK